MKMRIVIMVAVVLGLSAFTAEAAKEKKGKTNADVIAAKKAADGKAAAAKLRADWDMGELKMMRVVLDDSQYSPELKTSFANAIDKFTDQQEDLLAKVEADADYEAAARKKRANANAAFQEKMAAAYANPDFKKDMARRMKALDKEIDAIAMSAEKLMAALDSVGVSKEQKDRIAPVVKEANKKVKAEVEKSETKSAKDKKSRDKIVASYKDARKKLRQELTPEQREKLTKKLADEA